MGVWVRDRFCLRVTPSGIIGSREGSEDRDRDN